MNQITRCPKCGNRLITRERDGHGAYTACFLCGWCKDDGEPQDERDVRGQRRRKPRRIREGLAL